jgi:hypothetical protein
MHTQRALYAQGYLFYCSFATVSFPPSSCQYVQQQWLLLQHTSTAVQVMDEIQILTTNIFLLHECIKFLNLIVNFSLVSLCYYGQCNTYLTNKASVGLYDAQTTHFC